MSTITDQIADAILAALNTNRPIGIPVAQDSRGDEIDPIPSIVMYLLTDDVVPMHGDIGGGRGSQLRPPPGPVVKRRLTIVIECRAAVTDGTAPRKAVEPSRAWVVMALVGQHFGRLAEEVREMRTEYQLAQRDQHYIRAATEIAVDYQTRVSDLEQSA